VRCSAGEKPRGSRSSRGERRLRPITAIIGGDQQNVVRGSDDPLSGAKRTSDPFRSARADWYDVLLRASGAVMRRRQFIRLLGGAFVSLPLAVHAQQHERMRRIGVLVADDEDDTEIKARLAALAKALEELGWFDGRNIQIEYRAAGSDAERLRRHAAELADEIAKLADLVFLANAFHGVPDRARLAKAVGATLKPGGQFAIVNWHKRPRDETPILGEPRGPKTELRMSPEETIQVCRGRRVEVLKHGRDTTLSLWCCI
jgi:hypothetical protein